MDDLKQPSDFLRMMHATGQATKELIAKYPTASGATAGVSQPPQPPQFSSAEIAASKSGS